MTPNEIKVLKIAEQNHEVIKRKISALLGFSTDYASYVLERMAHEGYIGKVSREKYSIQPKGIDALLSQLYLLDSKLKVELEKLQMDSERVEQEINRLIEHKNNMVLSPIEERV